ncbi:MAG: restriction endonuclease [Ignavibacteriales bacterium]
MADIETPIKFDRCSLCRSEYIRIRPSLLSLDHIRNMNIEDFKELVVHVLKEHGYNVFESDKENAEEDDSFILESHKAEKRRWHVESWNLFKCVNSEKSLDLEGVKRFYQLLISDNAEHGYVITTGDFAEDALKFAKDKPIELINGKQFLNLVRKASTPQAYCTECLKIPAGVRASLKKLRARIEALNRIEKEVSGKWTAPLHLDLMFGDTARKIQSLFNTVSERGKKRLETKLHTNIQNLASSIAKVERGFKSFEKTVQEFSDEK